MADNKKNINYTNNDGAKYRYSASRDKKEPAPKKAPKIKEALTKRAVFWKTNRTFAIIVLILAVLLFSALSIFRAVHRSSSHAEDYYAEAGTEQSLNGMISDAKSLVSINEALNPDGDLNAECRAIAEKLDGEKSSPFWSDPDLAKKLFDKTEAIYNQIYYGDSSEVAKSDAKELFVSFDSVYKSLGSSEDYLETASDYNDVVSKFPVSLFSIKKAPVFERYETGAETDDTEDIQYPTGDEDESESFIANIINKIVKAVKSIFAGFSVVQIIAIVIGVIILIKLIKGRNR